MTSLARPAEVSLRQRTQGIVALMVSNLFSWVDSSCSSPCRRIICLLRAMGRRHWSDRGPARPRRIQRQHRGRPRGRRRLLAGRNHGPPWSGDGHREPGRSRRAGTYFGSGGLSPAIGGSLGLLFGRIAYDYGKQHDLQLSTWLLFCAIGSATAFLLWINRQRFDQVRNRAPAAPATPLPTSVPARTAG